MSGFLATILVLHIFAGLFGMIFLTAYLLSFSKKDADFARLSRFSFSALISFLASWILGGYYYLTYYGKVSKPIILRGNFAWVHKILMESKEHLFLFLPFLALSVFLITFFSGKQLAKDNKLKMAVGFLVFLAQSLGLAITIFGMVVSGAVAK